MGATNVAALIDRTRGGLVALLIAISLLLSALPAAAGPNASYGLGSGWDFLDATISKWEQQTDPKAPKPKNITWESLRHITWE